MSEPVTRRERGGRRRWRRLWIEVPLAVLLVLYLGLAGLSWWILATAHEDGARTMEEFRGDEVEALVALVRSDAHALPERNRAVWALGQIGDPRAEPVLETYYTGGPCDHSRLLCQKELKKAIARCKGENWAPRWLPLLPHRP
jgi:hypothetical protein